MSNDANNSSVLIFPKNQATDYEETAVAWLVINNCGRGWNHPFTYPMETSVAASDSWGNYSAVLAASNGQQFEVVNDPSGDTIKYKGPANSPEEIEIINSLQKGTINACVYKSGRLYAIKTGVSPQQKAIFSFKPTIWIGVVSQVEQGEIINAAVMSTINTEISLLGISSADIVMTGGGPGPTSTPFNFTLQNVRYA